MFSRETGGTPAQDVVRKNKNDCDDLHKHDDVDFSRASHHHTLGIGKGQAAPGDDFQNALFAIQSLQSVTETLTADVELLQEQMELLTAGVSVLIERIDALETFQAAAYGLFNDIGTRLNALEAASHSHG